MTIITQRVVIPLTGGMDSTYLMYLAKSKNYDVFPLIYDDGTPFYRQKILIPATEMVRHAGLNERLKIINTYPTKYEALEDGENGYIPGRNLALLMSALCYTDFLSAKEIWLGFAASNKESYADQKRETFEEFVDLYNRTYNTRIVVQLPLEHMTRRDVAQAGLDLRIPFEHTISCVRPPVPSMNCGRCDRCVERRDALGVADRTRYFYQY